MDPSFVSRATERVPSARVTGGTGSASAKAILFGEHAAVYGEPALAVPLLSLTARARASVADGPSQLRCALYTGSLDGAPERLRPTVAAIVETLDAIGAAGRSIRVDVESDIPTERGLGSSAAVAAAIVDAVTAALGADIDDDGRYELVQASERAAHGTPSGLDARSVRARGPVWFSRGSASPVPLAAPLHLVIADTGVHGRTRRAVEDVRDRRAAAPAETDDLIRRLGALSRAGRDALGRGDRTTVGTAMDDAHAILTTLGVGHTALDRLAVAARGAGALGAKLTGGGQGGCLLALAPDPDAAEHIADALRSRGAASTWTTTLEAST